MAPPGPQPYLDRESREKVDREHGGELNASIEEALTAGTEEQSTAGMEGQLNVSMEEQLIASMEEQMNLQRVDVDRVAGVGGDVRRAGALGQFDVLTAARTDACVLLTGRTREVRDLAYLIHKISGWGDGGFRVIDCTRPEEELLQRLYVSVAGPAEYDSQVPHARPAQDGSVLLQEVGRLSICLQRGLADLLEELRGRGSARYLRRRIMACNSYPLLPSVMAGEFDDRLFYRLNVIHLPVGNRG